MSVFQKLALTLLISLPALSGVAQTDPAFNRVLAGYTYKVESGIPGKRVYISCQRSINAQGQIVGAGNLDVQTKQIFDNLKVELARVGASLTDIQQVSYRVKNLSLVRTSFDRAISANLPVSPQIREFKDVQTLLKDDMLLEIEVIAVVN